MGKQINRIAAQKKLLANLWNILRSATQNGSISVPLEDLLDMSELCGAVGGANASSDLVQTRQSAQQAVADVVFKQLEEEKSFVKEVLQLSRILRLPGVHEVDAKLASMWRGTLLGSFRSVLWEHRRFEEVFALFFFLLNPFNGL